MIEDSSDTVWGVMDFIPRTKFSDIRETTVTQYEVSSVLNIAREGGSMNRCYMGFPRGTAAKDVKLEHLQAVARRIFYLC